MMELNKKELKKISFSFRTISSRLMRVAFAEYDLILDKFLKYIENNEMIMEYIQSGNNYDFNAENEWKTVSSGDYIFSFGPSSENETFQIYMLLKYMNDNLKNIGYILHPIYKKQKFQDNVDLFNNQVVFVLISNINEYLMKVGIDMGLDENVVWNVSGGQVNFAQGNAVINAIQNNNANLEELNTTISKILNSISDLEQENKETITDALEMISDELSKQTPKKNVINSGIKLLAPMISIVNGIPDLGDNINKIIEIASQFIQ